MQLLQSLAIRENNDFLNKFNRQKSEFFICQDGTTKHAQIIALEFIAATMSSIEPQCNHEALTSLRSGIIGRNHVFRTPFGLRPCVYADWTASGRALQQVSYNSLL